MANAGPGQDSVSILDLTINQLLSTEKIRRPIPSALALSPDGKVLYVFGSGSQFVALLDTTTNQKARIKTGESPVAIAFSPDGDSAYVVNREDNTVSVLDTRTFPPSIVCDVAVEDAPVSVAVTPDGEKVYVANSLDDSLSVFNPCTPIQGVSQAAGQARPKATLTSELLVFSFWSEPTNLQFDPNYPLQMLA